MEAGATAWEGAAGRMRQGGEGRWRRLYWSLVYPHRGHRIHPTMPGVLLIGLSLGIGAAAYNTANNILFITLSLLLSCLILSGVLSWLNLKRVQWRLVVAEPLRAGTDHVVAVEMQNGKRMLPSFGLWFTLGYSQGKGSKRLVQASRLDAEGDLRLEGAYRPERRGACRIEVLDAGSLFPFGFLRKLMGSQLVRNVVVWPQPVEYQGKPVLSMRRMRTGERSSRVGEGGDLLAVRKYADGDSHRQVHWKATARLRSLMVRQTSAEGQDELSLWVRTPESVWKRPEQFEILCRLAATLAEDLFRSGRLGLVAINDEAPRPIRQIRDLESLLDRIALLETVADEGKRAENFTVGRGRGRLITFAPEGNRGVAAHLNGEVAATA